MEKKTEHTPGPWHSFAGAVYIGEPTAPVFIARTCHPDRDTGSTITDGYERLANACLIAASPEMFDCLTMLFDACEDNASASEIVDYLDWDRLRAVYAKARGGAEG